ncbi:MAG: beta-galactosidase [Actinomycetota bacterium]
MRLPDQPRNASNTTKRTVTRLLLTGLGLLCLVGCGSGSSGPDERSADPPSSTPATATEATATTDTARRPTDGPLAAAGPGFGFSPGAGLRDQDDNRLAADLDAAVQAGARWIRLDVDWSLVESEPGRYDWASHDRVIGAARDRGLEVLAMLAYTPTWARPPDTTDKHPPLDDGAFHRFAAAAVDRYRPLGVHTWQVWNEPNSSLFWSTGPDPEHYGRLLGPTVDAILSVDPEATVVSGGLAPGLDRPEDGWLSPESFLQRLAATGALARVDAVGVHPYSFPARPLDQSSAPWNTFLRLPAIRELLLELDAGPDTLWITEYGAPTGEHERAVSDAEQAILIIEALEAARDWPWLGPLFLFALRDLQAVPEDLEWNYGLIAADGTPKPAWDELLVWSETAGGR